MRLSRACSVPRRPSPRCPSGSPVLRPRPIRLCTGSYGGAAPRTGAPLRFGVDPGLAGSAGGVQLPSAPDDAAKALAAVKELAPRGRQLGQVGAYTRAGLEVELQVRYHPPSGEAGDIPAWVAYVRHVVDTFGPNRRVVAMTITNEVNVQFSPNTSDDGSATRRRPARPP